MSAKQEIIDNLTVLTDNSCKSKISFIYYDILRQCEIEFPADSWALARNAGYTFKEVLKKTDEKTFNLLMWVLRFDFDENNHLIFIQKIVLSSLWRPGSTGTSPHEEGRGLDIIKIKPNIGPEIICSSTTASEPGFLVKLRTSSFSQNLANQYFSPWTMYYYNTAGILVEEPNRGISSNERIHLTHLHFTTPR